MEAVFVALAEVAEPLRLLMLGAGVVFGLIIGVIPGLGGLFGLSLLLPLSFSLDPYSAFALLLGMASVTTTSDTIPAVLLGVPGSVGAITTVIDGHPMAERGEAERALGAAFMASMLGGLIGAAVLAAMLPVMRPAILSLQTGDLFAISCAGLLFVATVSGPDPFKGAAALCLGAILSFIGLDPITASERLTGGFGYLWDGLPVSVVFLGLFAVPELVWLLERGRIARAGCPVRPGGLRAGMRAAIGHWPIVLRSSAIGAVVGAVPGIGVTVIDWLAYGAEARRKPRQPGEPAFGEGNIRGVIAPESANNAKEGGYLIPTLAIGVPGSATMALLLGAFMIHGLTPGPTMLTRDLPITISFVFFIALANLLGTGLCLVLAPRLARLAHIPAGAAVPVLVAVIVLGAFQARNDPGDCAVLLAIAPLGVAMRRLDWPRPAFSLGFVLGPVIERYFFLAVQTADGSLLARPSVALLCLVALAMAVRAQVLRRRRGRGAVRQVPGPGRMGNAAGDRGLALIVLLGAAGALLAFAPLPFEARLFPAAVAAIMGAAALAVLVRRPAAPPPPAEPHAGRAAAIVLGGTAACIGLVLLAGPYPAVFLTVAGGGLCARRPVRRLLAEAAAATMVAFLVFGNLAPAHWPDPLLAPALSGILGRPGG